MAGTYRIAAVVATMLWLGVVACSDEPDASTGAKDAVGNPACGPLGTREDGDCCPAGAAYIHETDECRAVGPPECATNVLAAPAACVPMWCWDRKDETGKACTSGETCRIVGRACTADELQSKKGCSAGFYPAADGTCHAAGSTVAAPAPPAKHAPVKPVAACGMPSFQDHKDGKASARGPGELPRCEPKQHQCPSTDFADVPKTSGSPFAITLHVLADAKAGGDGSPAKPYSTLAQALAKVSGKTLILLGAGTYVFGGTLPANVTLHGRCIADTALTGTSTATTVTATGTGSRRLANLTIAGPNKGLLVEAPAHVELQSVRVRDARSAAIKVTGAGAQVKATDVLVMDTRELLKTKNPGNYKRFGRALDVVKGGKAVLNGVRITAAREIAIAVFGAGSTVTATNLVVDGTLESARDGLLGMGAAVASGGRLTLNGARFHGNRTTGIHAAGAGTLIDGADLTIDETRRSAVVQAGALHGEGLVAVYGAKIKLTRLKSVGNRRHSITLDEAHFDVADLVVADTQPEANGAYGRGLVVFKASNVTIRRGLIARNHWAGVLVRESVFDARDLVIDDTRPMVVDDEGGQAISAGMVAKIFLTRAKITGSHGSGIFVDGPGSKVVLTDVAVERTHKNKSKDSYGVGVHISNAAELTARRLRLVGNTYSGLRVMFAARAYIRDVYVESWTKDRPDGGGGIVVSDIPSDNVAKDVAAGKLVIQPGSSHVDLERAHIANSAVFGLMQDSKTSVVARDMAIMDTHPGGHLNSYGRGIAARYFVNMQLYGVRVHRAREWGIGGFAPTVRAVGIEVRDTQPAITGDHGEGIVSYTEKQEGPLRGHLELIAGRVVGNHTAGIIGFRTRLDLDGVVVAKTRSATLSRTDRASGERVSQLQADGLLAFNTQAKVRRSVLVGNVRAGAFASGVEDVQLDASFVTDNGFGVAQQGAASAVAGASVVHGNRLANMFTGSLAVPSVPKRVVSKGH